MNASGDLDVDAHHTIEDVGLVLGQSVREAVGDRAGIRRFGQALAPMDDALARVVIDCSGRPYLAYRVQPPETQVGGVSARLFREFFRAFSTTAGVTLHVDALEGDDPHHMLEAVFKAFGRALDDAVGAEPRNPNVPSTKGSLD